MMPLFTFYISLFSLVFFVFVKIHTLENGGILYPSRIKKVKRTGDKLIHKTKRRIDAYRSLETTQMFQSIFLFLYEKMVDIYKRVAHREVPTSRLSARRIISTIRGERKLTPRAPSSEFLYDVAEFKRNTREE